MNTSEDIAEISKAFVKAVSEFGVAVKDATNPFFKSKYADLGSVNDACREGLKNNDLAVFQNVDGEKNILTTRLCHSSGQWMENSIPLIVAKNDMQGLGSAITYARRYGLMCALGIAPEDDDGNAAVSGQQSEAATKAPAMPEELTKIGKEFVDAAQVAPNLNALEKHLEANGYNTSTGEVAEGSNLFRLKAFNEGALTRCLDVVKARQTQLTDAMNNNDPFVPNEREAGQEG